MKFNLCTDHSHVIHKLCYCDYICQVVNTGIQMMTAEGRKSPVHVHVDRETPVHVHLKKKKKGKAGVPTAVEVMKASPCVEPLYGNKIN